MGALVMVKADEILLAVGVLSGLSVRRVVSLTTIPPKRAWYYCDKWSDKGWYEWGVVCDLGWLTQKGKTALSRAPVTSLWPFPVPRWSRALPVFVPHWHVPQDISWLQPPECDRDFSSFSSPAIAKAVPGPSGRVPCGFASGKVVCAGMLSKRLSTAGVLVHTAIVYIGAWGQRFRSKRYVYTWQSNCVSVKPWLRAGP